MKKYSVALFAIIFAIPLFAFALPTSFPSPAGFVTDTAGVLTQQTKQAIETELQNFAKVNGYEIAVLTVPNMDGDTIEDYAVKVFEKWKIGDKKLDTGVLFLVSIEDRKMRIEVGYGAEPVLTDTQASFILENAVKPLFKTGNYDAGISAGVRQIENSLSSEPVTTKPDNSNVNIDLHVLLFIFIAIQVLISAMARTKSWWFGGVAGGIISIVLMFIFASAIIFVIKAVIFIVSVLLGLLLDFFVSKHWNDTPRGPNIWWLGGGGSGRGGFGGGFGGFGGGSSGGGGSSSSW